MKTLFLIVFLIFPFASEAQDQSISCNTCYGSKEIECSNKCKAIASDTSSGKFQNCKRKCVVSSCSDSCKYNLKNNEPGGAPELVNCDYCTRNAQISCTNDCAENKDPVSCTKICISVTCRNTCTLPESTSNIYENSEGNSCAKCKEEQTTLCQTKCGLGSGAFACQVACVDRICEPNCLLD